MPNSCYNSGNNVADDDLFKQWRKDPSDANFGKIVSSLEPSIQYHVNRFGDVGISKGILHAEAVGLIRKSLDRYNPRKAGLSTHANNYLKKLSRFATTYGQIVRIPEHRVAKIRTFERVKSDLEDNLGRPPTSDELSDELGWPEREVGRMEKSLRGVVFESQVPFDTGFIQEKEQINRIVHAMGTALPPQQKEVLYYTYGLMDHPKLETNEIAAKLKVTPTRVIQLKHAIAAKLEPYLTGGPMTKSASFRTQKFIKRDDLRNNPNTIYLFGDNVKRRGMGGQAAEMRGEPNAIGIPTKHGPTMDPDSFFTDTEIETNKHIIDEAFSKIPKGRPIVIPEDGLGTGRAQLSDRAPRTYAYLQEKIRGLTA